MDMLHNLVQCSPTFIRLACVAFVSVCGGCRVNSASRDAVEHMHDAKAVVYGRIASRWMNSQRFTFFSHACVAEAWSQDSFHIN
jgi:hypothetical protein